MQKTRDAAKKPHRKPQKGSFSKGPKEQAQKNDKELAGKSSSTFPAKRKLSKDSPAKPFKKRVKLSSPASKGESPKTPGHKTAAHAEDSTLSRHMRKKKLTDARKKLAKPHFELGKEVKELWETLRKRNLESAEQSRITSMILQRIKGKASEMVTSHIMSRVLQTCLKFCNSEEKASIYDELRPHFLELAQNTYSHHLVVKMLDQAAADKNQLQKMVSSLHGNVVTFLRHPVASAVVEHAYKLASNVQKQELLAEFFSPEYRLFKGLVSKTSCRLVDLLAQEPSTKRRTVLEHMTASLQPILEKGIIDHSIIHRALIEYLSIAGKATAIDVLQQLSGPLLVRMIHTKDGAKLGVTCVSAGSRKERKKIIKGLKGHATKVACDLYGCSVLLAILNLVDDTEMLNKFIVNELANNVEQIAFDRHGRRVFLHLLSPQKMQYISADALTPWQIRNQDSEEANTEEKDEENKELLEGSFVNSKKDPFVRRTELLKSSLLAEKLIDACTSHAGDLLRSPIGKDLIYEVAKGGDDGILWHVTPSGVSRVHQAIADIGAQPRDAGDSDEHVFEQYHASRTIRKLILEPTVPDGVTAPSFASVIWNTALKGKCREWANGHSEKVVSAFKLCNDREVQKIAMEELQPLLDSGLLQNKTVTPEIAQGAKRKRAAKKK
eukprot:c23532_g1_i1 orf=129-2126(+)